MDAPNTNNNQQQATTSTPPATAPVTNQGPWYADLIGADGTINKAAWDKAPEFLKPYANTFAKYGKFEELLNGFGNVSHLAGKKALMPLPDDAPEAARKELEAHLRSINRVPDKPEGYGLKKPDDIDASLWNEGLATKAAELAHKYAIAPKAMQELMAVQLGSIKEQLSQAQAAQQKYFADQQNEIAAFAQQQNLALDKSNDLAQRGAKLLGIDFENNPGFKTAEIYRACVKAAQMLGEKPVVTGDSNPPEVKSFIDQARDIMYNAQNPDHAAFKNTNDPRHNMVKEKVNALYAAQFGGKR